MGIGGAKEGYSVFGLLNRCVSPMGKRMLRLWFLRPIINLDVCTLCSSAHSWQNLYPGCSEAWPWRRP